MVFKGRFFSSKKSDTSSPDGYSNNPRSFKSNSNTPIQSDKKRPKSLSPSLSKDNSPANSAASTPKSAAKSLRQKMGGLMVSYSEARRPFERARDGTRLDSVESDASEDEILVEAGLHMGLMRRKGELRNSVGFFTGKDFLDSVKGCNTKAPTRIPEGLHQLWTSTRQTNEAQLQLSPHSSLPLLIQLLLYF